MLRYIYFLCFLVDLELVFCYNSIRSSDRLHRKVARVRRRQQYGSEDSPLANVDLIDFLRKPDDPEEVLESYNLDNKRLQSKDEDYESPNDATPRMRRSRHEFAANEGTLAAHQASPLAKHPKKCSFSMFPFFSNKNKTKPAGRKHKKRKTHSFNFFKHKLTSNLHQTTPDEKEARSHPEPENATPKINGAAKKRMKMKTKRAKKSFPNIIHNSRQYYANRHKMNITDWMQGAILNDIRNDSTQDERAGYEGNNRRQKSVDDKFAANTAAEDLSVKQKDQQKILEELENRIRESYHVLRNLHI